MCIFIFDPSLNNAIKCLSLEKAFIAEFAKLSVDINLSRMDAEERSDFGAAWVWPEFRHTKQKGEIPTIVCQ